MKTQLNHSSNTQIALDLMLSYFFKDKYLNCLVMDASNKHRIDEKKCGIYSRAAFNNIFACPAAFIRGRRLFE